MYNFVLLYIYILIQCHTIYIILLQEITKLLTLAEAVSLVLEEDREEISILPSEEDQALTDEENIDDDLFENCTEGQDAEQLLPRDVCGRGKVAEKIDTEDETPTISQANDQSTGSERNNPKRKKKAPPKKVSWKKKKD